MFDQGRSLRTVCLNSYYTVVFCNLRDESQFRTMARQILSKNSDQLIDAYANAIVRPLRYFVIDNSPQCDSIFRFQTNIFLGELRTMYCNKKQFIKVRDYCYQIKKFSNPISKSTSNKICKKLKTVKHIIKFISHQPANKITRPILVNFPERVIDAMTNAALTFNKTPT